MVDDVGAPVAGTFVRILECCHTKRGPCGRVPLDDDGRTQVDVCPGDEGLVHVTLTPDARMYRVAPIRGFEVKTDLAVTLTVTRHASVLEHLRPASISE